MCGVGFNYSEYLLVYILLVILLILNTLLTIVIYLTCRDARTNKEKMKMRESMKEDIWMTRSFSCPRGLPPATQHLPRRRTVSQATADNLLELLLSPDSFYNHRGSILKTAGGRNSFVIEMEGSE